MQQQVLRMCSRVRRSDSAPSLMMNLILRPRRAATLPHWLAAVQWQWWRWLSVGLNIQLNYWLNGIENGVLSSLSLPHLSPNTETFS